MLERLSSLIGEVVLHSIRASGRLPREADGCQHKAKLWEYRELCANMRHYGNARLARLTMLFALTGGLLALLAGGELSREPEGVALKCLGILVAVSFWLVDMDIVTNWRAFRDRALIIEDELRLQQYGLRKERKETLFATIVSETNATYLLYGGVVVFWLYDLFLGRVV